MTPPVGQGGWLRRHSAKAAPGRRHGGVLRLLAELLLSLTLLLLLAAGALAWRIGTGPIDVTWAAQRIVPLIVPSGVSVQFDRMTLAWNGWQGGVGSPLAVTIDGVRDLGPDGEALVTIPRADLALPLWPLLLGRVEPGAVRLQAPRLMLDRTADGALRLASAAPPARLKATGPNRVLDALRDAIEPHGTGPLARLKRLDVQDLAVIVHDVSLGLTWYAGGSAALRRQPAGLDGNATLTATLGAASAALQAHATVDELGQTHLTAVLSPVDPAALARAAPRLHTDAAAWLAGFDAEVAAAVSATLDRDFTLINGNASLNIGAGTARLGDGIVALAGGTLLATATPTDVTLQQLHLDFAPARPGGTAPQLSATGALRRKPDAVSGQLDLSLDRVAFAELARYWPSGIGGGARPWITGNITAGTAHDLHVQLGLAAKPDFTDPAVTSLTGGFDADAVTGYWLRPLPPITAGRLRVDFAGPDVVIVRVLAGSQGPLSVAGSVVRITGLTARDQLADIRVPIKGPLKAVLHLLDQPRLNLLSRAHIGLGDVAGQFDGVLHLTLPLDVHVTIDSMRIAAEAQLAGVHLAGVVAGHDLDGAMLSAKIDNDGLAMNGTGRVAGLPSRLALAMDFRAGAPDEVTTSLQLHATATPAQLAALGIAVTSHLTGNATLQAAYDERRDGRADIRFDADLAGAALSLPLRWRKPAGGAASLHAHVLLDHGRLAGIDELRADGPGLKLRSKAEIIDGQPRVLDLQTVVIGRTQATGKLLIPASAPSAGAPIRLDLAGPTLDLSSLFTHSRPANTAARPPGHTVAPPKPQAPEEPGRPWQIDAHFDQVLLSGNQPVAPFTLHAENDGRHLAALSAEAGGKALIDARIVADPASGPRGRLLTLSAADAGLLLSAVDIADNIRGGRLSLSGRFDDSQTDPPLQATARISGFRVTDAPALARLLKAATLFGLVDILRGPGVSFSRLTLPFRYAGGTLDIGAASAVSPTLGVTATGRIDLDADTADLRGTIVPAYLLNTALGRLPLIGALFSPERGGGLFAADFSIRGAFSHPAVSVNPLSILVPGALRGLISK